jgi:hypothetical protein
MQYCDIFLNGIVVIGEAWMHPDTVERGRGSVTRKCPEFLVEKKSRPHCLQGRSWQVFFGITEAFS